MASGGRSVAYAEVEAGRVTGSRVEGRWSMRVDGVDEGRWGRWGR